MKDLARFREFQHIPSAVLAYAIHLDGEPVQTLNAGQLLHIASAYKVIVAIAIAETVAEGVYNWQDSHTIHTSMRVPDSPMLDEMPDGASFTIDQLMQAMIAVSDNTATNILQHIAGQERLHKTMVNIGLSSSAQLPQDLNEYYRLAHIGVEATQAIAALSTANDLVACYEHLFLKHRLAPVIHQHLLTILQSEDKQQEKRWQEGIVCYRKSGYLEIPPFYAMSMAGALTSDHHRMTFAFVLNLDEGDQATVENALQIFQQQLKLSLNELSQNLYEME